MASQSRVDHVRHRRVGAPGLERAGQRRRLEGNELEDLMQKRARRPAAGKLIPGHRHRARFGFIRDVQHVCIVCQSLDSRVRGHEQRAVPIAKGRILAPRIALDR